MKRNNAVKKTPHSRSNSNGNIDYDDFPEVVPFLEAVSNHNIGIYKAPKKRYRKFYNNSSICYNNDMKNTISEIKLKSKLKVINFVLVGIDIPDYISSGGNPEAIKNMSSKLKALGKRRRR